MWGRRQATIPTPDPRSSSASWAATRSQAFRWGKPTTSPSQPSTRLVMKADSLRKSARASTSDCWNRIHRTVSHRLLLLRHRAAEACITVFGVRQELKAAVGQQILGQVGPGSSAQDFELALNRA